MINLLSDIFVRNIALILFLTVGLGGFAEKRETKINPKGDGKTLTITFEEGDKDFVNLSKVIYQYDFKNDLVSVEQVFSPLVTKNTGMTSQVEHYSNNKKPDFFVMNYGKTYFDESGVDKIIEWTDEEDVTTRIEYYAKEKLLFFEKNVNDLKKYPFYRLSFIKTVMFEEQLPSGGQKPSFGLSMKYVKARSMVSFEKEPEPLSQADKDFVRYFALSYKVSQFMTLYSKKVLVKEGDTTYYVLMQDPLLQYIVPGQKAAISYYIGTFNEDLELLCVGFKDLE